MKKLSIYLLIFSSCFTLISCKPMGRKEMKKIIEAQNQQLGNCFKEGNADKLALMYSDSAKLCPNGYDFVVGRDSIRAFWAEDFKTSHVLEMNTHVLTVEGNREVLYETGKTTSSIVYNDSTYIVTVKYINVWRRQPDGSYKLDVDFWNKDAS